MSSTSMSDAEVVTCLPSCHLFTGITGNKSRPDALNLKLVTVSAAIIVACQIRVSELPLVKQTGRPQAPGREAPHAYLCTALVGAHQLAAVFGLILAHPGLSPCRWPLFSARSDILDVSSLTHCETQANACNYRCSQEYRHAF